MIFNIGDRVVRNHGYIGEGQVGTIIRLAPEEVDPRAYVRMDKDGRLVGWFFGRFSLYEQPLDYETDEHCGPQKDKKRFIGTTCSLYVLRCYDGIPRKSKPYDCTVQSVIVDHPKSRARKEYRGESKILRSVLLEVIGEMNFETDG